MSVLSYSCGIILVTSVVACGGNSEMNRLAMSPAHPMRSLLTEAEISSVDTPTALDAIQRLRPQYLWGGRFRAADYPMVYVDGMLVGGVNALGDIASTTIREIRRLDALEATTRYGTGHPGGAIVIITKHGR